jgi:spermidine/putrescine transport system permease protein
MKKNSSNITRYTWLTAVYAFLYIPIFVVVFYSFNNTQFSLVWHGMTLNWYQDLWRDTNLWVALFHSLLLALCASTIAVVIGSFAAMNLYWYRFRGRHLLYGLVFILIVTPDIVLGISLLILFSLMHLDLGFWSLLLAHITFCIPFVVITVYSRLVDFDSHLFEAARDLGASEITIFRRIMLPLALPAIIVGLLLSFTLSLDDVVISYFVAGPGYEILPLKIFSMARLGVRPELNALCTVIFVITVLLVLLSHMTLRKKT